MCGNIEILAHRENPPLQRSFFTGAAVNILDTLILGQFLERIKVQQEAHPHLPIAQAIDSILQKKGWRELYKGLSWHLFSNGFKGAFGWSIHNFCNHTVEKIYPQQNSISPSFSFIALVSCSTSFMETTLFLCPLERLKTFQMTRNNSLSLPLYKEIEKGGLQFIYRGWKWMVIQKSWSWVVYLTIYQKIRSLSLHHNKSKPLTMRQKIFLGITTGSLAACCNAPFDLIKTQIQKAETQSNAKAEVLIREIFQKHGWKGIFRGLNMKIGKTAWSTTFTLLVFDYLHVLPSNMQI